jgi:hypothetical protein
MAMAGSVRSSGMLDEAGTASVSSQLRNSVAS